MTSFSIILFISLCSKFIRNMLSLSVKSVSGEGSRILCPPPPEVQSQVSPIRGPESWTLNEHSKWLTKWRAEMQQMQKVITVTYIEKNSIQSVKAPGQGQVEEQAG